MRYDAKYIWMLLGLTLTSAGVAHAAFSPPQPHSAGSSPHAVAVADLNGDGVGDLAVAASGSNEVILLTGDGEGGLVPAGTVPAGKRPAGVVAADLDGDGNADLAVANELDGDVAVYLGNGAGSFSAAGTYPAGRHPEWVGAGDLDDDGLPELIVACKNDDAVAVLRNLGGGSFAPAVTYPTAGRPVAGVVADLDRDGDRDVAVACMLGDAVSVLRNDGSGALGAALSYTTGSEPRSLVAADFTGDGVVDLAAACRLANAVSLLPGDGSGGFGPASTHPVVANPVGMVRGDFDGDCTADLAVFSSNSTQAAILPGTGTGFAGAQSFDAGVRSDAAATADLNRDLLPDALLADENQGIVSALSNVGPGACSTFLVHRSSNPAAVRTAPEEAVTDRAPFDDDPGSLTDGNVYYYVVEHAGGMKLDLSVHANPSGDDVRLGFRDGRPDSAPVDRSRSTVTVEVNDVPADGVTPAGVRLIPMDANGVPLGAGLRVKVDRNALRPGTILGAVRDAGDGSYEVEVVSSAPGTGTLFVTVEGIVLSDAPTLTFLAP